MERLVSKEDVITIIQRMLDINGYRDGDAVSRRAVIALVDQMPDKWEDDLK
jgi:hypothetical protein